MYTCSLSFGFGAVHVSFTSITAGPQIVTFARNIARRSWRGSRPSRSLIWRTCRGRCAARRPWQAGLRRVWPSKVWLVMGTARKSAAIVVNIESPYIANLYAYCYIIRSYCILYFLYTSYYVYQFEKDDSWHRSHEITPPKRQGWRRTAQPSRRFCWWRSCWCGMPSELGMAKDVASGKSNVIYG